MIKSATSSHNTDGNAYSVVAADGTQRFYYFNVSLMRDVNFYLWNEDEAVGQDSFDFTIDAFHKPHNFVGNPLALPTDVAVTNLQTATTVLWHAFSAIEQVANAASYTHIAVSIIENTGAVDEVRLFGWGRELR